ncbi:MAG: class I SAM-dependent methyltransferase [Thermoplasmata archaeon]|nr:class I SAM-dependent methyltransferase [Thermoplasmata archaeon]
MSDKYCRFCKVPLSHTFVDLGMSPPSNSYLNSQQLQSMERFYPLHAYVCPNCFLVQLDEFESPDLIFSNYAYFSSYSQNWLDHANKYVEHMINDFGIGPSHQVMEIASNDGYLLQFFDKHGVPVLGIEPAANVAKVAEGKGIPCLVKFFGLNTAKELAKEDKKADLLLGNNVLAHVPDINNFVKGMKILLNSDGLITMEFPHLLKLMKFNQFDTIYHEHFSYFSLFTVKRIFEKHGLTIFDVEELDTHGGSLRIYAGHSEKIHSIGSKVESLIEKELTAGLGSLDTYFHFTEKVHKTKRELLSFLIQAKKSGKSIVGYGAAAKGNTLLNYCGIRHDFIDYVVDRSPHKQNLYLPGTHLPIYPTEKIGETKPDYLLILPWNIKEEVMEQMSHIREWEGRFVVPIPTLEVFD